MSPDILLCLEIKINSEGDQEGAIGVEGGNQVCGVLEDRKRKFFYQMLLTGQETECFLLLMSKAIVCCITNQHN